MEISHEKYKEELSKFYKLGYLTCSRDILEVLKNVLSEGEYILTEQFIKKKYNEFPWKAALGDE